MPADIPIPLINTARQTLTIDVGVTQCRLTVWRQPSDNGWYVTVDIPPNNPLIAGRRITINQPLLPPIPSVTLGGNLICLPLITTATDPNTTEPWSLTHQLIYRPADA